MSDKLEDKKQDIPVMPNIPDMKSMMDFIQKNEDKTSMYVLMQLLNPENLEFITEFPTVNYTKLAVKLMTWRDSVKYVFNLDDEDADTIVLEMIRQFMLKMTSHKRRRALEIINPLRHDPNAQTVYMENAKRKRFWGMGG